MPLDELDRLPLLAPQWAAPAGVGAALSTRAGGVSRGPYAGANLGIAVGDEPEAVAANRACFAAAIGARPVWLQQVHGVRVLRVDAGSADAAPAQADAAWTDVPGVACTVQVADCLPVLLATADGGAVAAAHAGWRGLAAGVLEATVAALCAARGCAPQALCAWLGPCIGPRHFEVGADVLAVFGAAPPRADDAFVPSRPRDGSPRWLADLQQLAQRRLQRAGVQRIDRLAACTVSEPQRFYSFRRDRVTGRQAAAVWLRG